jgi:CRISPR-associated protein Cas2
MNKVGHWYLLCYDIRSARRLQRVHKFLRTEAYALQESVFAWFGNQEDMEQLQRELISRINPGEDDFRGYRLPAGKAIKFWGASPFLDGIIDNGYPPHSNELPNPETDTVGELSNYDYKIHL